MENVKRNRSTSRKRQPSRLSNQQDLTSQRRWFKTKWPRARLERIMTEGEVRRQIVGMALAVALFIAAAIAMAHSFIVESFDLLPNQPGTETFAFAIFSCSCS